MKLEEAKALFPGEWIAFRELKDGENPDGKVDRHHWDREEFDKADTHHELHKDLAGIQRIIRPHFRFDATRPGSHRSL